MSVERWTDERLDQLAQLVESNSRTIQALADLAAEDRQERLQVWQEIREIQQEVREIQQEVREIQQEVREIQQEVREIQQEVRGLQTENQRMLDILLNDRRQDNQDS